MKKLLLFIVLILLSSCTAVKHKEDSKETEQYIILKNGRYLIDMCDEENMPRFPHRPTKPKASELAGMTEKEMDERIKKYIAAMDSHTDVLEGVIVKTRQRVELCRSLSVKS